MAALTNVRDTSELGGKYIALPVKGATTIYQGAIVAVDANGYAIPGKKAADLKAAGRAEETVENKGGDGDAVIRVSRGTFVFENSTSGKITAADVLGLCYMEDDQTVTKTGTGASVAGLVIRVDDEGVAVEMGFGPHQVQPVTGQTYSRKVDAAVLATLSGIAQSAHKFATDLRLLCHMKEIEEPFEAHQVGSSAMPYKRNPMRCERICALARYVIADSLNPAMTASIQWFERTLDDSANKRIAVSEAFLAVDAILNLYENVAAGLVVHEKVIARHIQEELPFMATENILMDAVKAGGDRQALHERIRTHSLAAGHRVKEEGLDNDLLERIAADPAFGLTREQIQKRLDPADYIGCCPEQVERFLAEYIQPVLEQYPQALQGRDVEITV